MHNIYNNITSVQNLCAAWREFARGKKGKRDVAEFSLNLSHNILLLHEELKNKTYRHGGYEAFNISDPKPRNIHKATVRDRLLHHAVHRVLYPYFNGRFIYDSYSCRLNKGTHKAMERFRQFAHKVSKNNTRTCWVLKCDIKKFFASIGHGKLLQVLRRHGLDVDTLWLMGEIIGSFNTKPGFGLPLGNLTSQLLVNIYMNEFDQWMKHRMKTKYYVRYADDFLILSHDRDYLLELISKISMFIEEKLILSLHPNKVFIQTFASGVDFLGWVHFPDHQVLRTTTKRRMFKRLSCQKSETIQSYLGLLGHGNAQKLQGRVLATYAPNVSMGWDKNAS